MMSDLNMLFNTSSQPVQMQAHQNYTDLSGFNELKKQAREDQRAALKPVAAQFEAIFVQQILQEARKVSFDDGWLDGNQGDFYKDWSDKQLAQDIAAKGILGFADSIVKQLSPNIPETSPVNMSEVKSPYSEQESKNSASLAKGFSQASSTEDALALRFVK